MLQFAAWGELVEIHAAQPGIGLPGCRARALPTLQGFLKAPRLGFNSLSFSAAQAEASFTMGYFREYGRGGIALPPTGILVPQTLKSLIRTCLAAH
jgi:hypothetical protein